MLILAEDEGRFGRISEPRSCWAPASERPIAPKQIIREYVYAYSAVCPSLGKMTSLILPRADSEMMSLFLQHVSEEFKDYIVIIVMDKAGWHTSKRLMLPPNVKILPLPPYSPELNPVEHIWDELREKSLSNKAFDNLDELENALCKGLMKITNNHEKVKSMTNFDYLNIIL